MLISYHNCPVTREVSALFIHIIRSSFIILEYVLYIKYKLIVGRYKGTVCYSLPGKVPVYSDHLQGLFDGALVMTTKGSSCDV